MNTRLRELELPTWAERDDGELQADQRGARDHHAVDAEPRQKARHRQRVEQAADRESGDDETPAIERLVSPRSKRNAARYGNNPSTQQPSMKTAAKQIAFGLVKIVR